MKKVLLNVMLVLFFAGPASARENLVHHSFMKGKYVGKVEPVVFKNTAMVGLFSGDGKYWNTANSGMTLDEMADEHRKNAMYIFNQTQLSNIEMIELIRASHLALPPDNMGQTYKVGCIPHGGGLKLFYRPAYKKGDTMLNGEKCLYDEMGLFFTGWYKGYHYNNVMWTLSACGNPAVPVAVERTAYVAPEEPDVYKENPIAPAKPAALPEDTVVRGNNNVNNNTLTILVKYDQPAAPPAPASAPAATAPASTGSSCNGDHHQSCNHKEKKDKVPFGQTFGGQVLANTIGTFVGGTGAVLAGNALLPQQRQTVIYGGGGGVIQQPGGPVSPPTGFTPISGGGSGFGFNP
ncbi:MAG: hypothetical protein KBD54_01575 [Candidatus Pacebacteria bacterium]|nr:hypothetical protein [Candidatus Paceibacterota bacterium]